MIEKNSTNSMKEVYGHMEVNTRLHKFHLKKKYL